MNGAIKHLQFGITHNDETIVCPSTIWSARMCPNSQMTIDPAKEKLNDLTADQCMYGKVDLSSVCIIIKLSSVSLTIKNSYNQNGNEN